MPLNGKRLKNWLFPTPEQRKEQMLREEVERQKRFEQRKAEQEHKLASLQRQEILAKQQLEVAEHQKQIRECRAKTVELQPRPRNIGTELDALAEQMFYGPNQKKLERGSGGNAS